MQNQIKQNKLKLISLNFGESRKFEMFKSGEIYQNDLKVIEKKWSNITRKYFSEQLGLGNQFLSSDDLSYL